LGCELLDEGNDTDALALMQLGEALKNRINICTSNHNSECGRWQHHRF
jgi:hypothetical protein